MFRQKIALLDLVMNMYAFVTTRTYGYFSLKSVLLFWGIDLEGVIYTYMKRIGKKPCCLKVIKIRDYNQ